MTESAYLLKLFEESKKLITQGISVVPINDKTGYRLISYSKRPDDTKDLDIIFRAMSNCTEDLKLAIITGKLSKNLECIDIDEKYKAGVSAEYLSTIKEYYPEIYDKLRIEKTKNNGLHIYYTLDEPIHQSKDIAKRLATQDELNKNPKQKTYAFIEVKTNNSSFTCYPSKGYTLLQDKPIPHLTREERDTLVNIATGFNEVIEKVVEVKVSKKALRNYSTNPWDDYNSDEGAFFELIQKEGWTVVSDNKNEVRFARPEHAGKKWVSACYYRNKQLFVIFTSSANIEAGNYKPSTLLSKINFHDDTKECFAWLIENGYGKLNKQYETKIIEKAIVNRLPLPKNISPQGQKEYELKKNDIDAKYPHGLFWEQTEEKGDISYRINRELILRVARDLNYRLYRGDLVYLDGNIIKRVAVSEFYSHLKQYVKEDEKDNILIYDKFENYIQQSGKFLISRLPNIEEAEILHDNHKTCYKAFSNVVLKITRNGYKKLNWDEIDKLIPDEKVIDYDFKEAEEGGLFVEFLKKAIINHDELRQKIGWMVHDYNDSINPYFLILTETVLNPKDGGGSGKNLFSSLVGMMTTIHHQSGAQIKTDNTYFQAWNGSRLMVVSDIPKKFDFEKLKNIFSNSATIKKLYKNEVTLAIQYLPKNVFDTNYSFDIADGGVKRRLRFVEFSDFFTRSGGVAAHFDGKRFPREGMEDDWEDEDWSGYYNYMVNCIVAYLKDPILRNVKMTESGWKKQFCVNHGENTFEFIEENIESFKFRHTIPQSDFQRIYDDFCSANGISIKYKKSAQKMNDALEEYCSHYKIFFEKGKNKTVNGVTTNCKWFGDGNEVEDDGLPF